MTIFNIDLVSSDLGVGIVGLDAYQGTGFIMYSQTDVRERFNIRSDQTSAFVSVTYDATEDQWYYLANSALVAFTPEPYDHLIASVDFAADTITMLDGAQDPIAGVSAGLIESDIQILPNMWMGSANAGEFMVTGTHMTIDFATERVDLTRDDLGKGIVGMDWLTGQGYIMYSDIDVRSRFDIRSDQAGSFVSVIYNADQNQWYYVGNSEFVAFDPLSTDVLIAQVDFGTDRIDMMNRDDSSDPLYVNGMLAGVYYTDIRIIANRWNWSKNKGEFQVFGSYLDLAPPMGPEPIELDGNSHSIAATDHRTGDGFIMYSAQDLQDRFPAINSYTDDHFVAVVYQDGAWYYDNNTRLVAFTPTETDILVAAVDFGENTVQDLQGYGS